MLYDVPEKCLGDGHADLPLLHKPLLHTPGLVTRCISSTDPVPQGHGHPGGHGVVLALNMTAALAKAYNPAGYQSL